MRPGHKAGALGFDRQHGLMLASPVMHAPHPAIVINTLIDTLPAGARILDLGAGGGTFPYEDYPPLRIAAAEIRPRPQAAARFGGRLAAASASALPFPDATFDLVIAHWLFEHVDDLAGTYDEVRRVLKPGGLLAAAVPNSASFEDRLYRCTSFVYKYLLFHFSKKIEHVQVLSFLNVNRELYRRGFILLRFREEEAGYCWLEVRQLRRLRPMIIACLSGLRRLGLDLFSGANYRLLYRLAVEPGETAESEAGGDYLRDE